ncbi:hypothetical protein DY000_02010297 [Brassica cretica]|uniref:RAB6-interacting golgin n=1 Tax=Brassica cretica TaxID=69181 RepID=A0ABQ7BT31_BRACR|nr:hypothetical protein DY000_02010297 [Brassica cretica]
MEKERHNKKRNNKSDYDTDSDHGENLKNFMAFTTLGSVKKSAAESVSSSVSSSVSGSTRGDDDVAGSEDDAKGFDLAKKYETLYAQWFTMVEDNSILAKEKVKLEAQIGEALKHASVKEEEEARQARVQLEETQKGLRMLNTGTDQLDHLLSIGQSDRCGLGFKGKSSKAEGHVQCGGLNSGHKANHGGIRLMDTWSGRSGHYGDGGMMSDEVFCCTWCCDVGAGVTCCGVVRCGVVINLYAGVGVLVGIRALGSDVLGDVFG